MNPLIEKLIKQFARLPRVGARGGQRIALALLQDKTGRRGGVNSVAMPRVQMARCALCVIYQTFGHWKSRAFSVGGIISWADCCPGRPAQPPMI